MATIVPTLNDGSNPRVIREDSQAGIQAQVDLAAAEGNHVVIPQGTHAMTGELTVTGTASQRIVIRGAGQSNSGGTKLQWSSDLGAGKFGVKAVNPSGGHPRIELRDISLKGPALSTSVGGTPSNMVGVEMCSAMNFRSVQIEGFYAGAKVVGDHNRVEGGNIGANRYGFWWKDQFTQGDFVMIDTDLTGNLLAGWAVAPSNVLAAATVVHGHFGFCPCSVYFEDGGSIGNLRMGSVQFVGTSFESTGNPHFWSPDRTAYASGVQFIGCGSFANGGASLRSSGDFDAMVAMGSIGNWVFENTNLTINTDAAYDPTVAGWFDCDTITTLDLRNAALRSEQAKAVTLGIPLIRAKSVRGIWRDFDERGTILKPQNTLTAKQAVAPQSGQRANPMATALPNNALTPFMGVAINSASGATSGYQEPALICTKGNGIPMDSNAVTSSDDLLMIDTTSANKVIKAAGTPTANQIVGVLASGAGAAGAVTVDVRPWVTA